MHVCCVVYEHYSLVCGPVRLCTACYVVYEHYSLVRGHVRLCAACGQTPFPECRLRRFLQLRIFCTTGFFAGKSPRTTTLSPDDGAQLLVCVCCVCCVCVCVCLWCVAMTLSLSLSLCVCVCMSLSVSLTAVSGFF